MPPPVPQPTRRQMLLAGSALLGSGLLAACGQDGEDAASSSVPTSSAPTSAAPAGPPPAGDPVAWPDVARVPHLFFHSLVVDPARAFDGDDKAGGYLDFMVTVDEFDAVIRQVYERGYVLVSPHELYEVGEDDVVRPKTLMVPEGRTPLILSLDDCSYYLYMDGDGFADRLIVAEDGRVRNEYTDAEGTTHVGAFDVVPRLDDFLAEHPDFSLNGARGVLAMTGYDGVFGYRTSAREFGDSPTFDADVAAATEVADALKDSGWEFASHTWGHRTVPKLTMEELEFDMRHWHEEVEPILGPTDMLIYPFGADVTGPGKYTEDNERYRYFRELGYRSFFLVDGTSKAWGQLEPGYYRGSRINVDGISLAAAVSGERPVLEEFFDPRSVLDPARPESIRGPKKPSPAPSSPAAAPRTPRP
ncbi:polysaccharide deacetylase family protein [Micrococcus luteus]|nr:polysaccharide deacetylase family protein [Micrococcus luteus]MCV7632786.1 polysaccharide deacetylase family protein [Micrococcus luteus]